jgi:hypothetical protein
MLKTAWDMGFKGFDGYLRVGVLRDPQQTPEYADHFRTGLLMSDAFGQRLLLFLFPDADVFRGYEPNATFSSFELPEIDFPPKCTEL